MKLQGRLAITVGLAAAGAILIMATVFSVVSARQQRQAFDEELLEVVSQPRQLIDEINARGQGGQRRPGLNDFFESDGEIDGVFTLIRITAPDGEVLIDDGLPAVSFSSDDSAQIFPLEIGDQRFRMAVASVGANRQGVLQIARSIEANEAGLAASRTQILAASLVGIVLAAAVGAVVARQLAEPITSVAVAARRMADGNELPEPIPVTRSDEVGELASSFNAMLAALQLSREQQKRLVADASHELRTPLTSLRLKLDLLNSHSDLDAQKQEELIAASATEVEELGDLVTELVSLATERSASEEQPVEASLTELASEVADQHRRRSGRPITLLSTNPAERFLVRPKMVCRAISNLLDNATKYSPSGTPIELVIDGGRVEARDRGEGISPADLEHVFDRFYRSAEARTRPGSGIGLAIVKSVADTHGGRVWADGGHDGVGAVVGFSITPEPHSNTRNSQSSG